MNSIGGRRQLALMEETLTLQKAALGPDHPDTLQSMLVLANIYNRLGRYQEGVALAESVVERRKVVLGLDHPETFRSIYYLGEHYRGSGRAAQAVVLLEPVVQRQGAVLGPSHPVTLSVKFALGRSLMDLGRTAEGLALFEEVVKGRAAALGPAHPHTLNAAFNLVGHLQQHGRVQDGLRIADESLKAAAGREGDPAVAAPVLRLRVIACDLRKDAAGYRVALARWEESLKSPGPVDLYNRACWNTRLSVLVRAADPSPAGTKQAEADADRAVEYLRNALAAGYRGLARYREGPGPRHAAGAGGLQAVAGDARSKTTAPESPK